MLVRTQGRWLVLLFMTISRSGRPYPCSFRSSFSLGRLGRGCCGVNSWQFIKKWQKSKYLQAVSCWLGKSLSSLLTMSSVCIHALILRSFLGDGVTKLITVNIAIIKSGHNLSSYLKNLRYNLHTVEMQCYSSVILPNADTCVIHILCQDSKHFHLLGKFPPLSTPTHVPPGNHLCDSLHHGLPVLQFNINAVIGIILSVITLLKFKYTSIEFTFSVSV